MRDHGLDQNQLEDVKGQIDTWREEGANEIADYWARRLGCRVADCPALPCSGSDYCAAHQDRLEYLQEGGSAAPSRRCGGRHA